VGPDAAFADDSAVGPLSVHKYRRVLFWVYPGSLVFGEGVDAMPECSAGDVGAREPRLRRWYTVLFTTVVAKVATIF
jgi:hypothetical protein